MLLSGVKLNSEWKLDVELESLKTRTKHLLKEDLIEVKLKPYDLHDSIVNIPKHNKPISSNSELSQNIEKSGNLMKGKLLLNCNNSTIWIQLKLAVYIKMILQIFA